MNVSAPPLVEPAYLTGPAFTQTLGPEVADLCELAGFAPDPEQRLALDMIFALDRRGRSAAFEVGVVCCRQNLKTGTFKQAALGWLFITEENLIVWSAHEFRTAQEAFRDMTVLIESNEYLDRRVKRIYRGNGEESIELNGGPRLIFKARTKSGGRGLTGDKVVLDEAFALQPDHMGALLPTLSVRPDPQVVYGSSAGLPDSHVLRGVRDRGRAGASPRLAYLEWCAPVGGCAAERCTHELDAAGCALDVEENIQRGNPLLGRTRSNGTGLTLEYVRSERQALPPKEFARERLGWWDEPAGADQPAIDSGLWASLTGPTPPKGADVVFALDVAPDHSTATITAAWTLPAGTKWVQVAEHGPGVEWVVGRAAELRERWGGRLVVEQTGTAAFLLPVLEQTEPVARRFFIDACSTLDVAVAVGSLRHGNQSELNAAVEIARWSTSGDAGQRVLSRKDPRVSPLVAAAMAVHALSSGPSSGGWMVSL